MSDDNQILIPESFIQLFIPPGRQRPSASRDAIAQRYEWCEDMAQMLVEPCRNALWDLGVTEADVLERTGTSLISPQTGLSEAESGWVTRRLAELLDWPWPAG